jgi:hypothetical protein
MTNNRPPATSHGAELEHRHPPGRPSPPGPEPVSEPGRGEHPLAVRGQLRLVGGEAGRALAAAQGRALAVLLASLRDVEVGQDEEVSP